MVSKALVLAAGMGSRLRSVIGEAPKPLTEVAGEPILNRTLRWLGRSGVGDVFINLHFQPEAIREAVGDGSRFGVRAQFVYEPELLGTAGALANIADRLDDQTLVVYGDNLLRCDLRSLLNAHRRGGAEATLALFDRNLHAHTGIAGGRVVLADDGAIAGFVEGGAAQSPLVNAGLYVVERTLLDLIPKGQPVDWGRDVFPAALAAGRRLQGHVLGPDEYCLGIDTPEAYRVGVELVLAHPEWDDAS